ncbi:hypothetical protein QKT26_gp22 [Carcinus maenas nudivirus]|uniref:Uncharacterized protein n=1 Tax=Carcinus maenas nudivirus TaxID=2880837 RepID=A0AAE9BZU9_9VIRU|nr:hypothetical protein QKT26_gp22 [Carcinus maenas nudivirus]UBZ25612.1 hypothetical protein CmNV_022 [Carcinus maenas nudivirus]
MLDLVENTVGEQSITQNILILLGAIVLLCLLIWISFKIAKN